MVAFRKWFPALAIFALLLGTAVTASAQITCTTTSGVPPLVRAEGLAELTGDIVLRCSGGTPTAADTAVNRVNFAIFLNTFITSRVLRTNGLSEALLLVDEPSADNLVECDPGVNVPAGCAAEGNGTGIVYGSGGVPNVYRGSLVQQFAGGTTPQQEYLSFPGVPFDPPGTLRERVIRITNVRANAARIGPGTLFNPTRIDAFISITSPTSISLNNPIQTVAWPTRGLSDFTLQDGPGSESPFFQCVGNPGTTDYEDEDGVFSGANVTTRARFTEGFNSAFKRRSRGDMAEIEANGTGTAIAAAPSGYSADVRPAVTVQAVGEQNSTESGLILSTDEMTGVADTGTRLMLQFANIPANTSVWVGLYEASAYGGSGVGEPDAEASRVRLVSLSDTTGAGNLGFTNLPGTSTGAPAGYALINSNNVAVYEIVGADPNRVDIIDIPIVVSFSGDAGAITPANSTPTVTGSLAPISNVGSESSTAVTTAPIPRFIETAISRDLFTINPCRTNILFPWVVNRDGFDTGIAIANTSADPFGTTGQSGNCKINYYNDGTTVVNPQTTTSTVGAGEVLRFVVSTGGTNGIAATPGFLGYVIAECDFQYAHGFAFVSDGPIGSARVAEGYLGLVLDEGIGSRTQYASEVLGN